MIMIVKTPGSQMGSPAAAEEGVHERPSVTSTAPKARGVATLDEAPRMSLRMSSQMSSQRPKNWGVVRFTSRPSGGGSRLEAVFRFPRVES